MRTVSNTISSCIFVLSVALLGCSRKAPGPHECNELALRIVGVRDEGMLQVEAVRKTVDDITVRCLVTPFDRELVRCLEESGGLRHQCFIEFRRRTGPESQLPPPE